MLKIIILLNDVVALNNNNNVQYTHTDTHTHRYDTVIILYTIMHTNLSTSYTGWAKLSDTTLHFYL